MSEDLQLVTPANKRFDGMHTNARIYEAIVDDLVIAVNGLVRREELRAQRAKNDSNLPPPTS